jgi:hypothetical protein
LPKEYFYEVIFKNNGVKNSHLNFVKKINSHLIIITYGTYKLKFCLLKKNLDSRSYLSSYVLICQATMASINDQSSQSQLKIDSTLIFISKFQISTHDYSIPTTWLHQVDFIGINNTNFLNRTITKHQQRELSN